MINALNIQDTEANKVGFSLCLGFLISLPFDSFYSQIVLACLLLHTLIHTPFHLYKKFMSRNTLILSSLFLLTLIFVWPASDKKQAWAEVSKQAALVIIPFIFALTGDDLVKKRNVLLTAFSIICCAVVLYLYFEAFKTIVFFKLPYSALFSSYFMNHSFSAPLDIHATYLSMFLFIALTHSLFELLRKKERNTRIAYSFIIVITLAALIQLGSRAVLAAVLITLLAVFPFFIQSMNRKKLRIAASVIISIILISLLTGPSFQKRLVTELREDLSETPIENTTIDSRMKRWQVAADLIRQKPMLGYGSGAETNLLKEKYFQNKMYNSYLNSLNAHNQYLSFLLMGGVVALLIYCVVLAFGLKAAVRNNDLLFAAFIVLLVCVSFSENYLMRNKGIFFFAFFYSFFLYSKERISSQKQLRTSGNLTQTFYVSTNTAI